MIDVYVVCPEHGDLWVQRDIAPGDPAYAHAAEPCQEWVARPQPQAEIECPRCGRRPGQAMAVGLGRVYPAGIVTDAKGLRIEYRHVEDVGE